MSDSDSLEPVGCRKTKLLRLVGPGSLLRCMQMHANAAAESSRWQHTWASMGVARWAESPSSVTGPRPHTWDEGVAGFWGWAGACRIIRRTRI